MCSETGQKMDYRIYHESSKKISDAKDLVKYHIPLSFVDETLKWRGVQRVF